MPDIDLSEKKGVMINRKTGGAYVDTREVIADELARIRAGHSDNKEYARLQLAVVEAARARRLLDRSFHNNMAVVEYETAMGRYDELEAEYDKGVDALIAFEAEHKIGEGR